MKTYADIKAEIAKLEAQADKVRKAEKAGVIGRIKEAIAIYALTAQDLGLGGRGKAPAPTKRLAGKPTVGVAKYRDPATGKTWTGRGKPPNWIAGAKDRTRFLIDGAVDEKRPGKARKTAKVAGPRAKRSSTVSAAGKRLQVPAKTPAAETEAATAQ